MTAPNGAGWQTLTDLARQEHLMRGWNRAVAVVLCTICPTCVQDGPCSRHADLYVAMTQLRRFPVL